MADILQTLHMSLSSKYKALVRKYTRKKISVSPKNISLDRPLNQSDGNFNHRGHLAVSGDILRCHKQDEGATDIQWVKPRDAAKCPRTYRSCHDIKKNYSLEIVLRWETCSRCRILDLTGCMAFKSSQILYATYNFSLNIKF